MALRKETTSIIIHGWPDKTATVADVIKVHRMVGMLRCGFHYVIEPDGTVHLTRRRDAVGNHTRDADTTSIAICLVGLSTANTGDATSEQAAQLGWLIEQIKAVYPESSVRYSANLKDTFEPPQEDA